MTVDKLIANARLNRTGTMSADDLRPAEVSKFLRMALGYLLDDIDYEVDKAAGSAVAARTLAMLISHMDDQPARAN